MLISKKRGVTTKHQAEIADRRRKVAQMYLNHLNPMNQDQIAQQLHVDRSTISRDIEALQEMWRQSALEDVTEHVSRELAELDQMEQEAAIMFQKARKDGKAGGASAANWYKLRLDTKTSRSRLLGLDKLTSIAVQKLLSDNQTSDDKINELKEALILSLGANKGGV